MKRMRLTLLLLIGLLVAACAQDPEQWFPGLVKFDTTQHQLQLDFPDNPLSGYLVNKSGIPFWYNGTSWDTLNVGGSSTSGYWAESGTNLSPTTVGHDILMPTGDFIFFRDATGGYNGFNSSTSNRLSIYAGGYSVAEFNSNTRFTINVTELSFNGIYLAPFSNHGTNFLGSSSLFWGRLYADIWYIYDVSTYVEKDGSNEISFTDVVNGTVALSELISSIASNGLTTSNDTVKLGGSLIEATTISNAGLYNLILEGYSTSDTASVRMNFKNDGRIAINSYDNSTYNSSTNVGINMWKNYFSMGYNGVVSSNYIEFENSGITINTEISGDGLLGGDYYGALYVDNSFVQKKYVDDEITAAGGGGSVTAGMQDTINALYQQVFVDTADLEKLVRMKYDTIPLIPWVKGEGLTGDSASFHVGASMIIKWESSAGDTLVVDNFVGNVDATAKSITIQIQIDDNYAFSSPTTILTATAITGTDASGTGQYITSFASQDIISGSYIKISITALSTDKPNQFLGQINGHMKN